MANSSQHNYNDENTFLLECKKNVNVIERYSGPDPLHLWYEYLLWIDEHFVIDFKQETIFDLILSACLCTFEKDERYKQDRRLIKLFIKFIHFQEEQDMHYKLMFTHGIGTEVADFYINWAHHFDMKNAFEKAEKIFQRGITAHAEPYDLLESAHQSFGYSMSQRILHKNDIDLSYKQRQLEEITSLRIDGVHSKTSIKSTALNRFNKEKLVNLCVPFQNSVQILAEPEKPQNTSIAQNLIDSARKMRREKRERASVSRRQLDFVESDASKVTSITQNLYELGFQPGNIRFPRTNLPQRLPATRAYEDPSIGSYRNQLPAYDKIMLIPATNVAYSSDELKAYKWFKKRGIVNSLTMEQDRVWAVGFDVPIRWANVFPRNNFPQPEWIVERISSNVLFNEIGPTKYMCNMNELYPNDSIEEFSWEEIMWRKRKSTSANTPVNRSVLKPNRTLNRTISMEVSKLSPIIEMDLAEPEPDSGAKLLRKKRESILRNATTAEPNKKRKTSIYATFDAFNDTCTTQMFGHALQGTAFSTPKEKMQKIDADSECEQLQEEVKLKLFVDETVAGNFTNQNDCDENESTLKRTNENKFDIYEDTTVTTRDMKEMKCINNSKGDSFSRNKENILTLGNQSKISTNSKLIGVENKFETLALANSQRKPEPVFKPLTEPPNTQNNNASQQPNALPFDIYMDRTNEILLKALENSRQIFECSQSLNDENKENLKTDNQSTKGVKSFEKDLTRVNEMITTLLNATKPDREVVKNESVVFKEPSLVTNLSCKRTETTKKPNQTAYSELLDTTEEFEAMEALCADSPPIQQQQSFHKTPIKRIDQHSVRLQTPNKSVNKLNEMALINSFRQRSILAAKEQPNDNTDKPITVDNSDDDNDDIGKSIYVPQPELKFNEKDADWHEVTIFIENPTTTNEYKVEDVDLDETRHRIDTHMLNLKDLNPFDAQVQKDVLNDLGFIDQLYGANNFNCILMNIVKPLKPRSTMEMNQRKYQIKKLIGEGSFGKVFLAEHTKTNEMIALKQQRPPNLWEYYVCLQIHTRITDEYVRNGFMSVDFAVIGNNSTIYASKFAKYGTLLNVCNKVKQVTGKAIEECIVMILVKQMLTIVEHFHKANFIHADIKPDNFLLMNKLSQNYKKPDIVVQLIDFGQSIDLNYFNNHVFWTKVQTEHFICTEMMDDKPWTYHCDLFCLASTIYTMVAGKYMVVSRCKSSDSYKPQKLPRYVNVTFWNDLFDTLINIPSLKKMPSLSRFQDLLDEQLNAIGSKKINEAITKFNKALDN